MGTLGAVASPLFAEEGQVNKKGWAGSNPAYHQLFGVSWFYNWNPNEHGTPGGPEWVPMVKGGWTVTDKHFNRVRHTKNITSLLGFNEPEQAKQGNISVADAVAAWPKLVALADEKKLRLGSPAPSSHARGMQWLADFMQEIKRQNLRVDFVAVHWYQHPKADKFQTWLKELNRRYRLPIWVTEFNGGPDECSEQGHHDFLRDALRHMDTTPYIERYAYFSPGPGNPNSLFNADGTPSKMGVLYQQAGKKGRTSRTPVS